MRAEWPVAGQKEIRWEFWGQRGLWEEERESVLSWMHSKRDVQKKREQLLAIRRDTD